MLDKKTASTLKLLNKLCDDGSYKVIEVTELMASLPNKLRFNKDLLNNNLEYLKAGEYVDVKHSDESTVCLAVLPKGRLILEDNTREDKMVAKFNKLFVFSIAVSGIMAFFGAFFAIYLSNKGWF